jgi:hypothetical protein
MNFTSPKSRAEFLNVTLRYVAEDRTPVLSIAPVRRIAAVTSFSQQASPEGEFDMMRGADRPRQGYRRRCLPALSPARAA